MSRGEHPLIATFRALGLEPREIPANELHEVPPGVQRWALVGGQWIEIGPREEGQKAA